MFINTSGFCYDSKNIPDQNMFIILFQYRLLQYSWFTIISRFPDHTVCIPDCIISKRLDIGSYDMASARGKGRPPADIPREKLEYFTEMGFTRVELADIFGVCVRTIGKFLNMYSLKREDRWHDLNGRFFQCFLCIYIKYYESCKQLVNTCQLLS